MPVVKVESADDGRLAGYWRFDPALAQAQGSVAEGRRGAAARKLRYRNPSSSPNPRHRWLTC
jgi:hypothetical protein